MAMVCDGGRYVVWWYALSNVTTGGPPLRRATPTPVCLFGTD